MKSKKKSRRTGRDAKRRVSFITEGAISMYSQSGDIDGHAPMNEGSVYYIAIEPPEDERFERDLEDTPFGFDVLDEGITVLLAVIGLGNNRFRVIMNPSRRDLVDLAGRG